MDVGLADVENLRVVRGYDFRERRRDARLISSRYTYHYQLNVASFRHICSSLYFDCKVTHNALFRK